MVRDLPGPTTSIQVVGPYGSTLICTAHVSRRLPMPWGELMNLPFWFAGNRMSSESGGANGGLGGGAGGVGALCTPTLQRQLDAAPGERRELVRHFAARRADPDDVEALTDEVEAFLDARLRDYTWPGNARELRRCVESVYATGSFTPLDLTAPRASMMPPSSGTDDPMRSIRELRLSEDGVVQRYASMVWEKTGGKQDETAELLGINRKTVATRLDHAWLARRARRRGR